MTFFFRSDDKFRVYKRSVDTILDFLGDIGGILEIVTALGFAVTAPFVFRTMNADLVNELYHL